MSKKAILNTLLISSALLGTTAAVNAATSAVKPESKLVTVEKEGAKLYKNSKLDASTTAKVGTVYKVDGYREINKKHYYRVYQQDKNGKNVYKGYLLNKDAKDLKAGAVAKKDRFVGVTAEKAPAWKNLYFNRKIKTYNGVKHSSNFEVKHTYKLGDKTYYSMYRADKWMGYMDASQVKVLTPEAVAEDKQAYKVVEDWNTYNDIYFTEKGTLTKGDKVTVKRIYTFSTGRQYGSLYNAEGKWIGYANMKALAEDKVADEEMQKAIDAANDAIKKAEEILSKAQASKESKEAAQKVIDAAKETVKNGNLEDIKKIPAQISDAIKALKPGATTIDIQRVQEAIANGKEVIKEVTAQGVGTQDQAAMKELEEAIANAEKVIPELKKGNASTEDADKAIDAINKAIDKLGSPVTSINIEELQNKIREAKDLVKKTDNTPVTGRDELIKEIEKAEKVLADAKAGKVTGKDVAEEVKALDDAMNNVKFDKQALANEVTAVQKLASDVYMTKDGEMKFVKAMTDIMNLSDNGANYGKYLEAKSVLSEAKAGLEKQPNKADGEALNKAINQVKDLAKLPNQGKDLYGIPALKEAYDKANELMKELEKDTKKENTATVKIFKDEVQKATQDLNLAFESLGLNETQLQGFIDEAKKLAANDEKFKNDKDFQAAVNALESVAKDTHFANYDKIQAAAKKVYDMMIKDLQAVYNGVLPWNNNQETVNPDVKPVKPATPKASSAADTAVAGKDLTGEQFGQAVLKAEPKVGDYYTAESYEAFTNAMTEAQTIIKAAQAKDVKVDADAAKKVNVAMKDLVDAQANLRFDRAKLESFSQAGNQAIQKWINTNTAKKTRESLQQKVEANGKAANKGFWNLGYKNTTENSNGVQDGEWANPKSFLATATDDDFKPTKANAEKLTQLVYNAENGYYKYIETVTVGSDDITSTQPGEQK